MIGSFYILKEFITPNAKNFTYCFLLFAKFRYRYMNGSNKKTLSSE